MPKTVCYIGYEVHISTFWTSKQTINGVDDCLNDVDILPFVETTNVVCFGDSSFVEDGVDGSSMVFYVEPITYVLALAIDGKRLAMTYVVDEERYQFLRELIGAIIVGTVCHDGWHAVSVVECTDEVVA